MTGILGWGNGYTNRKSFWMQRPKTAIEHRAFGSGKTMPDYPLWGVGTEVLERSSPHPRAVIMPGCRKS